MPDSVSPDSSRSGTDRTPAPVLIVDDHPMIREGLAARIAVQPDLIVCGEASDADQALALLDSEQPALIVLDLVLKGSHGLDLIKKIRRRGNTVKILVLSALEESLYAERALQAGAQGYINKQQAQENVIDAIRTVLRGEHYLSVEMRERLVGHALSGTPKPSGIASLSDRELEIFRLIGQGQSTRAIAADLHLSIHTIEAHRTNIRAKLNLRDGAELVQQAIQWVLEQG